MVGKRTKIEPTPKWGDIISTYFSAKKSPLFICPITVPSFIIPHLYISSLFVPCFLCEYALLDY